VNTEITDNNVGTAGWLFYDGECRVCCESARRFGRILARRRFELRPLQSPGVAQRLGLGDRDLLRETRLLLADGRNLGGAEAVVEIARHIWWAWPLWLASRLPGARPVLHAIYRVIAANRRCFGGVCKIPRRRAWLNRLPLLLLPAAVVAVRNALPRWVFMWLMAFAIYAGCKWLTYRDPLVQGLTVPARTRLTYLLCWPGMSLREFAGTLPAKERMNLASRWLAPTAKILAGAGLVWFLVPAIPADAWLLRGWAGMAGIIMMLHFGTFQLLAMTLQAGGLNARANMQAPSLARSLADFWGNRWNTGFNVLADRYGFRPLARRIGPRAALAVVFLSSGLLHETVITLPAGGGYGLPTAYFAIQAVGLFIERLPLIHRRRWLRRLFAWLVLLAPLGWLFPAVFVQNVILPMLHAIGATGNTP
jgi:predicted DCC family thiol-disulfide oxidoreductase YuxK